jgi:hypothetical protein
MNPQTNPIKKEECKHKKGKLILFCDDCRQIFELPIMMELYQTLVKEKERRNL